MLRTGTGVAVTGGAVWYATRDAVRTRYGASGTDSLSRTTALTATAFREYAAATRDIHGPYGVFGRSDPPALDPVEAWRERDRRPLADSTYDGRVHADFAVATYQTGDDRFVHLTWGALGLDDVTATDDLWGLVETPMHLTRVGVGVDLDRGWVRTASLPERDGDAAVVSLPGGASIRYPLAPPSREGSASDSHLSDRAEFMARARTSETEGGSAYASWIGFGPDRLAVAGSFVTDRRLPALTDGWEWGYGIGTKGLL
ncbi:MAG: hypothetical protein ABEJ31_12605 [Haloarculaceae archaeon]